MPESKTSAPAPGTTDFRETTKLERDDDAKAPEQMKKDKAFRETQPLDEK